MKIETIPENAKALSVKGSALVHARAVIGDNSAINHYGDIGSLEDRLADIGDITSDLKAQLGRDIMADAHRKAGELEAERREAQAPHEQKIADIRTAYRPLVERAEGVKQSVKVKLNAWIESERVRLAQEARKRQDEAQALIEEARKAREALAQSTGFDDDPEAVEDMEKEAAEAEVYAERASRLADSGPRVASAMGSARAAGQRTTWGAKAVDPVAMVKALANNPDVQAAALKVASAMMRSSKGSAQIDGVEAVENRSV